LHYRKITAKIAATIKSFPPSGPLIGLCSFTDFRPS
jgi:hypothetical protein